jgi:hypothetical protein
MIAGSSVATDGLLPLAGNITRGVRAGGACRGLHLHMLLVCVCRFVVLTLHRLALLHIVRITVRVTHLGYVGLARLAS